MVRWRRGEAGSERVGRTAARCLGGRINRQKNREMGGPLALDDRRLMGGTTTNQKLSLMVRGALERRHDRGGTCGGRCPIVWGVKWRRATKNREMGWALAINGHRLNILHTTTNQKQAAVTEGTMKGRGDEREARGKHHTIFVRRHYS